MFRTLTTSFVQAGSRVAMARVASVPVSRTVAFSLPRQVQFSTSSSSSSTTERNLDDIVKSIDTTLTPEQKEYVAGLKKKLRGGSLTKPSVYRNVPKPEDITGMGNFMPKMADNAEELIDYALSHIPKRAGPRRTREKKRMAHRMEIKRANDARRKQEFIAATQRKVLKYKKVQEEINKVRKDAEIMRETMRLKQEVAQARAAKKQQQQ